MIIHYFAAIIYWKSLTNNLRAKPVLLFQCCKWLAYCSSSILKILASTAKSQSIYFIDFMTDINSISKIGICFIFYSYKQHRLRRRREQNNAVHDLLKIAFYSKRERFSKPVCCVYMYLKRKLMLGFCYKRKNISTAAELVKNDWGEEKAEIEEKRMRWVFHMSIGRIWLCVVIDEYVYLWLLCTLEPKSYLFIAENMTEKVAILCC